MKWSDLRNRIHRLGTGQAAILALGGFYLAYGWFWLSEKACDPDRIDGAKLLFWLEAAVSVGVTLVMLVVWFGRPKQEKT